MRADVNRLLTGPDGHIPSPLAGVAALLLDDNDPEQTLEILNGSQWIQLLGELVASGTPITHKVLDGLTQDMHVRHLRNVLVHTGALDRQEDGLEALEPWTRSLFAGLSPRTAAVLRSYALWSVLPRARRRAARGRIATSTPRYVRARINIANQFLTWLEDNHIPLADATQHNVNTWVGHGASTRHRLRDFLRWAHDRGLAADLEVRWLGSDGLPEQILDDDERWALLQRCLRDASLSLRLRVAGALILLYGQIPSRIVELTTDSITTNESETYLTLRDHPVLLPPPLAALITQLIAHNRRAQATTSGAETPAWLFPSTRMSSHLGHGRLTLLINNEIGVFVRPARGAALCALAGDLPAPVLAELLGLSISAATGWVAVAARDEAHYLQARMTNPPQRDDAMKPNHA